jgi:hypothetical protein
MKTCSLVWINQEQNKSLNICNILKLEYVVFALNVRIRPARNIRKDGQTSNKR